MLKSASNALAELDTYGTASTAEKYLDEIKQIVAGINDALPFGVKVAVA